MPMRQIICKGSIAFATLALIMGGFVMSPIPVQAATKYTTVSKCTRVTHWYYRRGKKKYYYTTSCKKVRVLTSSLGSLKSTSSVYYPGYNLMQSTGSRRSLPSSLVAVCGDGKNIYSAVTSSTCAGHQGIAWCVHASSSKYCPKY